MENVREITKEQKEIVESGWYCNLKGWGTSFVPNQYVWLTANIEPSLYGKAWAGPGGCSTCAKSCGHGSVEHMKKAKTLKSSSGSNDIIVCDDKGCSTIT